MALKLVELALYGNAKSMGGSYVSNQTKWDSNHLTLLKKKGGCLFNVINAVQSDMHVTTPKNEIKIK